METVSNTIDAITEDPNTPMIYMGYFVLVLSILSCCAHFISIYLFRQFRKHGQRNTQDSKGTLVSNPCPGWQCQKSAHYTESAEHRLDGENILTSILSGYHQSLPPNISEDQPHFTLLQRMQHLPFSMNSLFSTGRDQPTTTPDLESPSQQKPYLHFEQ